MIRTVKLALIVVFCAVMPACFAPSKTTQNQEVGRSVALKNDKALIWDFDGTIADSLNNFLTAFNAVAPRYGIKTIAPQEIETVRSMAVHDLLKRQGVAWYQLPFFIRSVKAQAESQVSHLPAHKGVPALIKKLHEQGYKLFITSSNDLSAIQAFLVTHGIDKCFIDIYHASFLDTLYKSRKLKKLMSKHNLTNGKTLYIGDEQRDVQAAQASRVPIACVTWGFNTPSFLAEQNPTYVVSRVEDLEVIIEKHFTNASLEKSIQQSHSSLSISGEKVAKNPITS